MQKYSTIEHSDWWQKWYTYRIILFNCINTNEAGRGAGPIRMYQILLSCSLHSIRVSFVTFEKQGVVKDHDNMHCQGTWYPRLKLHVHNACLGSHTQSHTLWHCHIFNYIGTIIPRCIKWKDSIILGYIVCQIQTIHNFTIHNHSIQKWDHIDLLVMTHHYPKFYDLRHHSMTQKQVDYG